jgi:hypothetical protein
MISLQGSLRNCQVDTGWAERLRSDRFENPNEMICPVWNGRDLMGRPASPDSFQTKVEGCNTPLDRVAVENELRPHYMEETTVDAQGFRSDLYINPSSDSSAPFVYRTENMCQLYPYDWDDRQDALVSTYSRKAQIMQHKTKALIMQRLAGF